jgi:hypothetical protein
MTIILDPMPIRELQRRWICASFAIHFDMSPMDFDVAWDDTSERILVCIFCPVHRVPVYTWAMQIHSDDTEYRFWGANADLVSFPFQV